MERGRYTCRFECGWVFEPSALETDEDIQIVATMHARRHVGDGLDAAELLLREEAQKWGEGA